MSACAEMVGDVSFGEIIAGHGQAVGMNEAGKSEKLPSAGSLAGGEIL